MTRPSDWARRASAKSRGWLHAYLANKDPYTAAANLGALIVWSNQPLYPLYVAWIVGPNAWPSLLTWLSTPFFVMVPIAARQSSRAGRGLFVIAGLANSILSLKAFGAASGIGWFFLPCLAIALGFFRWREWHTILALVVLIGLSAAATGHLGAPIHTFADTEYRSLATLNFYSAVALTLYLGFAAARMRLTGRGGSAAGTYQA